MALRHPEALRENAQERTFLPATRPDNNELSGFLDKYFNEAPAIEQPTDFSWAAKVEAAENDEARESFALRVAQRQVDTNEALPVTNIDWRDIAKAVNAARHARTVSNLPIGAISASIARALAGTSNRLPIEAAAPRFPLEAMTRIRQMAALPCNWDREGAEAPTAPAVAAAAYLIAEVAEFGRQGGWRRVDPLTSSPIADGGLQVEWRGTSGRIDVQANPDGTFGYLLAWGRQGEHIEYDEADIVDEENLRRLIQRVVTS